jgi:hypothetical protein
VAATGARGVYFANCDAARAAGRAPLHAGTPGYREGLDRDGVACEAWARTTSRALVTLGLSEAEEGHPASQAEVLRRRVGAPI